MIQFFFLLTVQLTLLDKPTQEIILISLSIEDELSKYAALLSGGTSSSSSSQLLISHVAHHQPTSQQTIT